MRQGEALGLQWKDVDLEAGTAAIRHQLQRVDGKLALVDVKAKRSRRTVELPALATSALRQHRQAQRLERLAAGPLWDDRLGLVFTSSRGTPLLARNVLRSLDRWCAAAGLPHMPWHDLRHTFATLLSSQHVAPRRAMEALGHSGIAITMDTYTHVLADQPREVSAAMDALFTPSGGD